MGQYFDVETGFHYNYFRIYIPDLGRYSQSDPIGLEGGWNTFVYVDGNPLNQTDTLGLSPQDIKKISETFHKTVKDMTTKGERLKFYYFNNALSYNRDDENGYWPKALAGTLNFIFSNGESTLICGQQWERVQSEINKLKLDDKWEFKSQYDPGHQYGIGVSNNPNDPKLVLDPWKDSFKQIYK